MPKFHGPADGHWHPMRPDGIARLLTGVNVPWWIAGGWALDLFLGFQTRAHADIDVGVLRRNVSDVVAALSGWELFEASSETLYRLAHHERPRPEVNSLWCRPSDAQSWAFELMLDEADGDAWVFRRLRTIRLPLANAVKRTPDGIPCLAPEIQLLYKAQRPRPKDHDDFERVLERLGHGERSWLCDTLSTVDPKHVWLKKLRAWPSS